MAIKFQFVAGDRVFNLNDNGMEHLKELDEKRPDGLAKEIVAMLTWEEDLHNFQEPTTLLEVYDRIASMIETAITAGEMKRD